MHRSASRLTRILACAAVPVMLVVAGCSSDSGSKKESDGSSSSAPGAKKSVAAVALGEVRRAARPVQGDLHEDDHLAGPQGQEQGGFTGHVQRHLGARKLLWNGLDDNGVKGSQYRWLDVGFTRFDSDQALGSGAKRAADDLTKQLAKTRTAEGAKKIAESPVSGIGEQATKITYDLNKTGEDFKYATIVARTGNAVVTLTYNGAGYAGAKTPSGADILKDAEKAAKEAVAAVADANAAPDDKQSSPSASPSKSAKSSN